MLVDNPLREQAVVDADSEEDLDAESDPLAAVLLRAVHDLGINPDWLQLDGHEPEPALIEVDVEELKEEVTQAFPRGNWKRDDTSANAFFAACEEDQASYFDDWTVFGASEEPERLPPLQAAGPLTDGAKETLDLAMSGLTKKEKVSRKNILASSLKSLVPEKRKARRRSLSAEVAPKVQPTDAPAVVPAKKHKRKNAAKTANAAKSTAAAQPKPKPKKSSS